MKYSMNKTPILLAAALVTLVGLATTAIAQTGGPPSAADVGAAQGLAAVLAPISGSDWVVKSEDNVCGVSSARQITNPAKVDYEALMNATSEMKELKRAGIKRDSARGQALVTKARDKVRRAARSVMTEKQYCSVWKKISHKKNRAVTDITAAVKAKLNP